MRALQFTAYGGPKVSTAGPAGAQVTMAARTAAARALTQIDSLLAQNRSWISAAFPFDRTAEASRVGQGGHVRGELVLIP